MFSCCWFGPVQKLGLAFEYEEDEKKKQFISKFNVHHKQNRLTKVNKTFKSAWANLPLKMLSSSTVAARRGAAYANVM